MSSLHFVSEEDPLFELCVSHRRFEHPVVVNHDQGHMVVKYLEKEEFQKAVDFMLR